MKLFKYNIKAIVLSGLLTTTLVFSSCKRFLDLQPISQSSVTSFYKTADDFKQAINGTYAAVAGLLVGDHFAYYMLLTDLRSDNCTEFDLGGSRDEQKNAIDRFEETASNETVTAFWQDSYKVIQRANAVLDHIDNAPLDQNLKDQYKGEAKVLRAWAYYNLVRFYGGVPLTVTSQINIEESYKKGRASVETVYEQIISDLADAENLLPSSYPDIETGRVTKGTAEGLLGSVYLTRKKYEEAVTAFEKVINSHQYELLSDYSDLYKAGMQGNKESIWQIQFKSGTDNLGSMFPNWYAPQGSGDILTSTGGAFGFCQPTDDLAADYEEEDVRREAIGDGFINSQNDYEAAKYAKYYVIRETGSGHDDSGADWYVLRYANVLLMCAEAINEVNQGPTPESYSYLNKVRTRAGLSPVSGLTYESFKATVYHEERLEYPFEGHRWFDLLRTGRALDVMNSKVSQAGDTATIGIISPVKDYQLLYPIPERVVSVSPDIEQNPGY